MYINITHKYVYINNNLYMNNSTPAVVICQKYIYLYMLLININYNWSVFIAYYQALWMVETCQRSHRPLMTQWTADLIREKVHHMRVFVEEFLSVSWAVESQTKNQKQKWNSADSQWKRWFSSAAETLPHAASSSYQRGRTDEMMTIWTNGHLEYRTHHVSRHGIYIWKEEQITGRIITTEAERDQINIIKTFKHCITLNK